EECWRDRAGGMLAEDGLVRIPGFLRNLVEHAADRKEQLGRLAHDLVDPVEPEPQRDEHGSQNAELQSCGCAAERAHPALAYRDARPPFAQPLESRGAAAARTRALTPGHLVPRRGFGQPRAVARCGLRQAREAVLRIGEIAAIRTGLGGARHQQVARLRRALGNAAYEVLRDAGARVTRLVTQIPGLAGHPRRTLDSRNAIRIDALAAVTLFACGEGACFAILFVLALRVAQHLRTAAHRP